MAIGKLNRRVIDELKAAGLEIAEHGGWASGEVKVSICHSPTDPDYVNLTVTLPNGVVLSGGQMHWQDLLDEIRDQRASMDELAYLERTYPNPRPDVDETE
jgi:hypothetical protein